MHYYIDGYNLLFYLVGSRVGDLRAQREWIIQNLNTKIESLALDFDLSLVFDSPLNPGEGSRSHYGHLEILYTPEGVSADDYIIQLLKESRDPTKKIIVTNDRELAMRARHQHASAQGIDHFMNWLHRRYKNQKKAKPLEKEKIHKETPNLIKPKSPESPIIAKSKPVKQPQIKLLPLPMPPKEDPTNVPGSFDFYLSHFQAADEKAFGVKEKSQSQKKEMKLKKPPKKPTNPFNEPATENDPTFSEMERWLQIFEKRDQKNSL